MYTGKAETLTAYEPHDYSLLNGDTVATNVEVFWFNDSTSPMAYDAAIGVNTASLMAVQSNIGLQSLLPVFYAHPIGVSQLSLDSLVPNSPYTLMLLAHQGNETKSCFYHFTTGEEMVSKYCQSEVGQGSDNLYYKISFNTLNYENLDRLYAYNHDKSLFAPYNLVPDTGTWTTTIQREQSYFFSLIPDPDMQFPNAPEVRVFFDFNHDGVFDVATESFVTSKDNPRLATITIPLSALLGKTRMRIANGITNGFPLEPCLGALDFVVTIAPAVQCTGFGYTASQQAPACFGANTGFIQLSPKGGKTPYHVRWNVGDTTLNLAHKGFGYYRASLSDAEGCTLRTPMFSLVQPEAIVLDTLLQGYWAITGGVGPYHVAIINNQDTIKQLDFSSKVLYPTGLAEGEYTVNVVDQNHCQQIFQYHTSVNGLSEAETTMLFSVFPNPCHATFQLNVPIHEVFQLSLFDQYGVAMAPPIALGENMFSITHLPSGIYVLKYSNVHHVLFTKLRKE
jgi:hypothetical protein